MIHVNNSLAVYLIFISKKIRTRLSIINVRHVVHSRGSLQLRWRARHRPGLKVLPVLPIQVQAQKVFIDKIFILLNIYITLISFKLFFQN